MYPAREARSYGCEMWDALTRIGYKDHRKATYVISRLGPGAFGESIFSADLRECCVASDFQNQGVWCARPLLDDINLSSFAFLTLTLTANGRTAAHP